jgi:hypothetical protein
MPSRYNPRNLNPLQLKTLAIFQRLATMEEHIAARREDGTITLWNLPHAHGDHFHVGHSVLRSRDASGLTNPSVWMALDRKGLIEGQFPDMVILRPEALEYPVGELGLFMEHSDH